MNRLILACLVFAVLTGGCDRPRAKVADEKKSVVPPGEIGSALPSFVLADLRGQRLASTDLSGKVAIVDFWAPWCAPCLKEMPGYQKLLDQYRSKGLVVIGFKADVMPDPEDSLQFAERLGVHYPIAIGSKEIQEKFGGLKGLPMTFIYDRHGILQSKVIGFEYTSTIEERVKKFL